MADWFDSGVDGLESWSFTSLSCEPQAQKEISEFNRELVSYV